MDMLFAQKKILQSKFVQRLISSKKDSSRAGRFMFFPVMGYSQETGLEYGLSGTYNFYVQKADTAIRTSSINAFATLTTKHQSNLKLTTDIWSSKNKYHYIGEVKYRDFPFSFYGIGDNTLAKDKDLLLQKLFRLNLEVEKRLLKNYYTGLNAMFEDFTYSDQSNEGIFNRSAFYGAEGGKYLALGLSQVYDSRNSNTNPSKGVYGRLKYAYAPDFWGGHNFDGSFLSVDLRAFFRIDKHLIVGINSIYQTLIGKEIPFYLMPQLGNDEMMRGYYQGRYRDKNLWAIQGELRYKVHPRIGLATFISTGTVYPEKINLSKLKMSYGGGVRYFFDLEHEANIRLDYAVGEKRPQEKRQNGLYLSIGQAF